MKTLADIGASSHSVTDTDMRYKGVFDVAYESVKVFNGFVLVRMSQNRL